MDEEKYNRILDRLDQIHNEKWARMEAKQDLILSKLVNAEEYKEAITSLASDASVVEEALKAQQLAKPAVN